MVDLVPQRSRYWIRSTSRLEVLASSGCRRKSIFFLAKIWPVLVLAALHPWKIVESDVEAAYSQIRDVHREVNGRPLRGSKDHFHFWLLLGAACRLVNPIPNFWSKADDLIIKYGISSYGSYSETIFKQFWIRCSSLDQDCNLLVTGQRCSVFWIHSMPIRLSLQDKDCCLWLWNFELLWIVNSPV